MKLRRCHIDVDRNPIPSVLVTGANGFIAFHTVKLLLEQGYSVVGTVRSERKFPYLLNAFRDYSKNLELVIVEDITAPGAFDEVIRTHAFDAVFHLSSPFVFNINDIAQDLLEPAIKGTTGILNSIKSYGPTVKRVVITSSFVAMVDQKQHPRPGYVYTEADWNPVRSSPPPTLSHPLTMMIQTTYEEGLEHPMNGYFASKTLAEQAAWEFMKTEQPQFTLTTLCPPFVFGPPDQEVTSISQLNTSAAVMYRLYNGTSKSHGEMWIWVDVRDLAQAHILALETPEAANQRYFITSSDFSTQDILDYIWTHHPEHAAAKDVFRGTPGIPMLPSGGVYTYNDSKSVRELDLKYRDFDTMMKDTVARFEELDARPFPDKLLKLPDSQPPPHHLPTTSPPLIHCHCFKMSLSQTTPDGHPVPNLPIRGSHLSATSEAIPGPTVYVGPSSSKHIVGQRVEGYAPGSQPNTKGGLTAGVDDEAIARSPVGPQPPPVTQADLQAVVQQILGPLTTLQEQLQELQELQEDGVRSLENKYQNTEMELRRLKSDMQGAVQSLETKSGNIQTGIHDLRADVRDVLRKTATLQTEVKFINANLNIITPRVDRIQDSLPLIKFNSILSCRDLANVLPSGSVYTYDNSKSVRELGLKYRDFDMMKDTIARFEELDARNASNVRTA
ncbi:methylglyoxal reductase (NADPH-dependent) gre2 [Tulasnella sp. 403]|nr:methylglyoxal reductase (NADPH-dependent) gre2 [Tulasnella sp. 403]